MRAVRAECPDTDPACRAAEGGHTPATARLSLSKRPASVCYFGRHLAAAVRALPTPAPLPPPVYLRSAISVATKMVSKPIDSPWSQRALHLVGRVTRDPRGPDWRYGWEQR